MPVENLMLHGEQLQHPKPKDHRIVILTKRQQQIITLTAQGISRKNIGERLFFSDSTAKNELIEINVLLGTKTATQAALVALDLHIINRAAIVDPEQQPRSIDSLSDREREIMETIIESKRDERFRRNFAERLTIEEATMRTHLSNIYKKLGVHNMTHAAALFKILTTPEQPIPENTIVYIAEDTDKRSHELSLTQDDIRLLALLVHGTPFDKITAGQNSKDITEQINKIKSVIRTPARLIALIDGLKKRIITLPSHEEEVEISPDFVRDNLNILKVLLNF